MIENESTRRFLYGPDVSHLFVEGNKKPTADVVIIGGGQAGPAIAAEIYRLDPTVSTAVLETHSSLARGASRASAECARTCWTPECIKEMMVHSMQVFTDPDAYFGPGAAEKLNFRQRGYLWLGRTQQDAEALRKNAELMNQWGLKHIQYLEGDDIDYLRKQYPWLPQDITAAKIDPQAGWLDSNALAYLSARLAEDTDFLLETPATEIIVEGDRVKGVKTPRGVISTNTVVIAAGPASRRLAETAGVELPITCVVRESFTPNYRHDESLSDAPFVIGSYPYPYFRPEGNGLLFGWACNRRSTDFPNIEAPTDPRFPGATLEILGRQFQHQEEEGFRNSQYLHNLPRTNHQAGYYVHRKLPNGGLSERAIIDSTPIEGLILAVANAGHGIMTAPAVGRIAAGYVVEQEPGIPLYEHFQLGVLSVPYEEGSGL